MDQDALVTDPETPLQRALKTPRWKRTRAQHDLVLQQTWTIQRFTGVNRHDRRVAVVHATRKARASVRLMVLRESRKAEKAKRAVDKAKRAARRAARVSSGSCSPASPA